MRSKRMSLNDARLYLILDRQVHSYAKLFEIAQKALAAGIHIIQLRDKHGSAKDILHFSKQILKLIRGRIPYIINDRVDLAKVGSVTGVHLGQDDIPIKQARKMLGSKALIGMSCQTLAHAQQAQRNGADYIGFGSVFATLTKPDRSPMDLKLFKRIMHHIHIPVFAIGGIDFRNVHQLKAIGIQRIAVCRAICQAAHIETTVKRFLEITK